MKKTACLFAIVRFMPYLETREFANVGVLLAAPNKGFLKYKLAPNRLKRVSEFFDDLDGRLYKNTVDTFKEELDRVVSLANGMYGPATTELFNEITRYRESVVHFDAIGSLLTENPEVELGLLYDRYVGRNFVTKEYREQQMVRVLKAKLNPRIDFKYKERALNAGFLQYKLPLVADVGATLRAIKPLAFRHKTPELLVDHGVAWVEKIRRLLNANTLKPENVLIAVEGPQEANDNFEQAYQDVRGRMKELDVNVEEYQSEEKIFTFAANIPDVGNFELA